MYVICHLTYVTLGGSALTEDVLREGGGTPTIYQEIL